MFEGHSKYTCLNLNNGKKQTHTQIGRRARKKKTRSEGKIVIAKAISAKKKCRYLIFFSFFRSI